MSLISHYSKDEFVTEFTLDLGHGMRGELVNTDSGFKGLILAHVVGNNLCSTVVPLAMPHKSTLWGLEMEGAAITISGPPVTCINCPENYKGTVVRGQWKTPGE